MQRGSSVKEEGWECKIQLSQSEGKTMSSIFPLPRMEGSAEVPEEDFCSKHHLKKGAGTSTVNMGNSTTSLSATSFRGCKALAMLQIWCVWWWWGGGLLAFPHEER